MCGSTPAKGYALFYCFPDDYIGWDNVDAMPTVYRKGGEFAVATLLAACAPASPPMMSWRTY
ncbi:hypothetical protein MHEL_41290 [Mycolicibacterium helvum]|uniref:Uncharacterized protein n=1 Tax=Mycolicibacterium helvum TaxID=1534349 RepID=A0A7I7TCK4_9MYCO|nr:hypothetical protein MHEL_41290 [Mycolicibacterium helvum]